MLDRRQIITSAAASTLPLISLPSFAQDFPKAGMNIKYVVPFAPGGLTDIMARIVAQKLNEAWKVPVVVENKAGGNAQIGAEQVAKGSSDGSQLLAITLTHAANVSLFPTASYNFTKDLRPVALLAGSPMLIVVPANSPINTLQDLIKTSKTKTLNAGTSGNGSPPHLTMALFNDLNKSKMIHVPYRGGALSMNDLVGGQLDVVFSNFPESIALVKGGKLKAIAVCSLQRNALVPDVPTVLEAGMPGLFVENWTAAMIHAKTPDAIVEKYAREIIKSMFSKDVEDRAKVQGFKVSPKGPQEFGAFLQTEISRWNRLIKAAKITAS
jgi:tripartite-type tricarboxylate transporter receptor subunit TctC